jgi:hypothetical protein
MCLSFHIAKKIIEGVANATNKAYRNLGGQLISYCLKQESCIS